MNDSPIIALNRAVAVARVSGPRAGLEALATLPRLASYHLLHAVRGMFEAELGNFSAAAAHFRTAEKLAELPSEKAFLAQQIRDLEQRSMRGGG